MTSPAPWHGWVWDRGRWRHVCASPTLEEARRELDRLAPVRNNLYHTITSGHVPDWTPGVLAWEESG